VHPDPENCSTDRLPLLTINGGSSSLKFAVFESGRRTLSGKIDRIGLSDSRFTAIDSENHRQTDDRIAISDRQAAVRLLIDYLDKTTGMNRIAAIGHRIVHGGNRFLRPERVTPELIQELRRIKSYAPNHLPGEIELIEAFRKLDSNRAQVVCFDTAFHHDLPRVAQILPIPRRYEALGVRRYGFHGLSYSYLMKELARVAGPDAAGGRVILAHLGAGASLAAVREGQSIDTTMAFTPTAGIVMATRTGDIDPGLIGFLAQTEGMTPDQFYRMTNHDSGLLGVSETSPDFRDLLSREAVDVRAAEAVDLFCYRVKLAIGGFAAALGGIDTLIFSGGIGENSAEARKRICHGLDFLGIQIDEQQNRSNAPLISNPGLPVQVRVIATDEEAMIAKAISELV
jgi:acetate kinase